MRMYSISAGYGIHELCEEHPEALKDALHLQTLPAPSSQPSVTVTVRQQLQITGHKQAGATKEAKKKKNMPTS